MKTIKELTIVELKAICYDAQRTLQVAEQEIVLREKSNPTETKSSE
jgi:hypothetical protein